MQGKKLKKFPRTWRCGESKITKSCFLKRAGGGNPLLHFARPICADPKKDAELKIFHYLFLPKDVLLKNLINFTPPFFFLFLTRAPRGDALIHKSMGGAAKGIQLPHFLIFEPFFFFRGRGWGDFCLGYFCQ